MKGADLNGLNLQKRLLLLFIVGLLGLPVPGMIAWGQETETTPPPLVLWIQEGALWLWQAGQRSEQIASDVEALYPAPDAALADGHIAYTQRLADGSQGLFVLRRGDGHIQQIATAPLFGQVAWQDNETILYNTLRQPTQLTVENNDDLWRVRLGEQQGQPEALSPGGAFNLSPYGAWLIITRSGSYGGEEGSLSLMNTRSDETDELLRFEAISSGAHTGFYPPVQWLDDTTALVFIPEADALYERSDVTIWRVDTAQSAAQTAAHITRQAEVAASLFGLPVASAAHLAWLRTGLRLDQYELMIADSDGAGQQVYASGTANLTAFTGWVDSRRFVYRTEAGLWLGEVGAEPRLLPTRTSIYETLDGRWLLYLELVEAPRLMLLDVLDEDAAAQEIASTPGISTFDVLSFPR